MVGSIVGIQSIDLLDLLQSQERELVFEESVAFALRRSVDRNENSSFICVVAVDGRELDEVAFAIGGHGEIGDDIAVKGRSVHVQWRVLGAGEWSVDVLGLEVSSVETAQTSQGVVGTCAASADDQVIVHELGLVDATDSCERLGFGGRGVEEVVVAAIVSSEEQSHRCSACRCPSDGDMLGITAKLANVLLHPLQCLDLVSKTVVGSAALDDLIRSQKAVGTHTVVEVHNDNIVVASFD